jgi:hypothetical protein
VRFALPTRVDDLIDSAKKARDDVKRKESCGIALLVAIVVVLVGAEVVVQLLQSVPRWVASATLPVAGTLSGFVTGLATGRWSKRSKSPLGSFVDNSLRDMITKASQAKEIHLGVSEALTIWARDETRIATLDDESQLRSSLTSVVKHIFIVEQET